MNLLERLPKVNDARLLALLLDPQGDWTPRSDDEPRTVIIGTPVRPEAALPGTIVSRMMESLAEAERELARQPWTERTPVLDKPSRDPAFRPQPVGRMAVASGVVNGLSVFSDGTAAIGAPIVLSAEQKLASDPTAYATHWRRRVQDARARLDATWQEAVALRERLQDAERDGRVVPRQDIARLVELVGNSIAL